MIEHILALSILVFVNPNDPTAKTMYSSGINDCDNYTFKMPPATKYPLLRVSFPVFDDNENTINPGVYEVKINNQQYVQLIQGSKAIGKVSIIKIIKLIKPVSIPSVEITSQDDKAIYYKARFDSAEYYFRLIINPEN